MAKPRINIRFDAEVLAGMDAAVADGRAANLTDALERASREWLGMPSSEPAVDAVPEGSAPSPGRNGRAAASRATPSARARAGVRPIPKRGKR